MKKYYREVALGNWGEGSSLLVLKRLTLLPVKNRAGSGLLSTPGGIENTLRVDMGEILSMFFLGNTKRLSSNVTVIEI